MQFGFTNLFLNVTLSLICLGLTGCGGGEVLPLTTLDELDRSDGGFRLKAPGELYSGYLVEYYVGAETNQLRSRSLIRNGKLTDYPRDGTPTDNSRWRKSSSMANRTASA